MSCQSGVGENCVFGVVFFFFFVSMYVFMSMCESAKGDMYARAKLCPPEREKQTSTPAHRLCVSWSRCTGRARGARRCRRFSVSTRAGVRAAYSTPAPVAAGESQLIQCQVHFRWRSYCRVVVFAHVIVVCCLFLCVLFVCFVVVMCV